MSPFYLRCCLLPLCFLVDVNIWHKSFYTLYPSPSVHPLASSPELFPPVTQNFPLNPLTSLSGHSFLFCFVLIIYLAVPDFHCDMQKLIFGMWDLFPWLGMEPKSPALGAWILSYWTTREVPIRPFFTAYDFVCILTLDHFSFRTSEWSGVPGEAPVIVFFFSPLNFSHPWMGCNTASVYVQLSPIFRANPSVNLGQVFSSWFSCSCGTLHITMRCKLKEEHWCNQGRQIRVWTTSPCSSHMLSCLA